MSDNILKTIYRLFKNKKAVSVAISTAILASTVIALGFVTLYWTQQRAAESNEIYFENTENNIQKIGEAITLEHVYYDHTNNVLNFWILNSGKSNNLQLKNVILSNSSWSQEFSEVDMQYFNGTDAAGVDVGEEAVIQISVNLVQQLVKYTMEINTERGNYFVSEVFA